MQYFGSLRGRKAVKWFSSTFKDFQINSSTFKALILLNEIQALLRLFKARANPVMLPLLCPKRSQSHGLNSPCILVPLSIMFLLVF